MIVSLNSIKYFINKQINYFTINFCIYFYKNFIFILFIKKHIYLYTFYIYLFLGTYKKGYIIINITKVFNEMNYNKLPD